MHAWTTDIYFPQFWKPKSKNRYLHSQVLRRALLGLQRLPSHDGWEERMEGEDRSLIFYEGSNLIPSVCPTPMTSFESPPEHKNLGWVREYWSTAGADLRTPCWLHTLLSGLVCSLSISQSLSLIVTSQELCLSKNLTGIWSRRKRSSCQVTHPFTVFT